MLLFFIIPYTWTQLAYNQLEMGCLTYSGTTCIKLCQLGQQDCSSALICEYGYFLFQEDPYQTVDDKLTLYCMDCVEHPYTWYSSRTCSYDYTIENGDSSSGTYIQNVREYTELYYIGPALSNGVSTDVLPRESQYKYQPYVCSGCKSFCTGEQGCHEISSPYTEDSSIMGITCLPTFEFQNEMCVSCSPDCLTCKDGECLKCMNGYMIKNNKCTSCMDNCAQCYMATTTLQELCLECNAGYVASLDQLSCEACGNECARCEYTSYQTVDYQYPTRYQVRILTPQVANLYVKRCRQCSTKTFISYNGNDCITCQIRFCDVCYHSIRGGVTTQDIDFEPAKTGDNVSALICFKCQSGYVLSTDGKLCSSLPALPHIVSNCDRNFYKGTDIKCLQCQTDYILDQAINGCYGQCSSYISHCSICYSYKSLDTTIYLDSDGQIKTRSAQTLFQCISCDSGYYPNLFTGYCDPCPNNCAQCWQYSQTYNFTDFLTKMQPINTSQKEVLLNDIPILVECTSCQDGYQLYGNQCLGCTTDCQIENPNQDPAVMGDDLISSCVFKSQYAFCGQCYDPFNDRSLVSDQSECISCPMNCLACRDRATNENTNPYFNPDNSNLLRYGRLCYKIQNDQLSPLMKVTYNSILNLPVLCTYNTVSIYNTNRCKHTAAITVHVYCDETEYNTKYATLNPYDQVFYYYLNDSYYLDSQEKATIQFSQIQNYDVYSKMNQLPLEKLDLYVKFVSTATHTCNFLKTTIFESDLQRNVFALTDFSMHISSEDNIPITFYVNGMLEFGSFQHIGISNINILPAEKTSAFGLNFYGTLPTVVSLINSKIGYLQQDNGIQFSLLLTNILSLTLIDVTISKLSTNDQITLDQSMISNYTITITNLIIEHSNFINTILFPLSPFGDFTINGLSIIDCTLNNTRLFEDNGEYQEFVASIAITNMIIKQTYLYDESAILYSSNLQQFQLSHIDLVGCNFNQSELFISNIFTVSHVYIYGNVFTNESRVFVSADQVADNTLFNTQITTSSIVILNLKFTSNTCYNINCLMVLQTPFTPKDLSTSLFLSDLYIYNNYIEIDLIKVQSVSSAIVRIVKIKSATLSNIVIDTQLTITVISLQQIASLDIDTFLCDWSNPQVGPKDMDPRTKVSNETRILYPFNNKIPANSQCSKEKYKFGSYNSYCLHVQDFLYGVRIQDAALKGLLGIDTGFIYIQSYESLIKQTSDYTDETASKDIFYHDYSNELIILNNIRIFNTSISAVSPVANLAAIVIKSDQQQTVIIDGVTAIGNHLHQQVESITTEIAPCLVILTTNGNISINNMEYQSNRATQSQYGINVFKSYTLQITNSLFNYTNILESNWLDRIDEHQITQYSTLLSYFYIESNGANLYVQSKYLILASVQMLNTQSMTGSSLYFSGQDTATIAIQNSQFVNQSASLEYIDASMGGSFYLECSKSKLALTLSYVTINHSMARLKGGCIYIDPSIFEHTYQIDQSHFQGCSSLSSSVLDASFSVSSKVLPAIMITNTKIMGNQFGSFLRTLPDISYEEELLIVTGTALFVQNYGILTMQSIEFLDIDVQGLLLLTNIVEVIFQDITIKTSKLFIQSLIEITHYNQYSLVSLNNIIISNVTEQAILTQAQFYGTFGSQCAQATTLVESLNTQVCTEQEDLRSFYQELYNYRQISQTKLDNSTLYEYYDTLTEDDKYTLKTIDLDALTIGSVYQDIVMYNNTISMSNYELCFFTYISEKFTITNDTALIRLSPVKDINFVNLSSITLKNNKCLRCEGGLLQINNFDTGARNAEISFMICQSNVVGYFGCLVITTQSKASYVSGRLLTVSNFNVNITKSIFTRNQAKMGTAISIIGLSVNLEQSSFSDNTATLIGGALLFVYDSENKNILNQYDNSYIQNTAQLGSAIYMMGNTLNDQSLAQLYIYHNEGTQVESVPQKLTLRMKAGQQIDIKTFGTADGDLDDDGVIDGENGQIIDILNINGTTLPTMTSKYLLLPSGQAISKYKYYYSETEEQVPYNWIFRIINLDSNGKEVKSISSSETCNIAGRLMDNQSIDLKKLFLTNFTSLSIVAFDTNTNTFNLDNLQIYFDPYLPSNLYLQLKFTCTSIKIPIYNQNSPYNVSGYDTNYALYVNIRTIPCQVGEAYSDQLCTSCDAANTYSVQENSVQCKGINSIQMEEVLPVRLKLKSQYWRPSSLNDNIEQCYNLVSNCLGGWVAGDASCFDGHIGALCEQCDIYGTRGSPYSISKKYTCGACSDTLSANILIIIGISIFTLVTMVMSVKGNYEFIENLVHEQVLQSIGARTKVSQNNASILMKQLTNYLQIIAALTSFRISLPTSFVSSMEVMGNPTQSMAYSLDCFLVSIASIDLLYFRMAWALLMPIFYVLLFFFGYFFGVLIGLAPFKIGVAYTTFIYMFLYLQPTLVGGFMALLSSRTISGVQWVQGNVSYEYYTDNHQYYLIIFIGPMLLLWSVIFPLIFLHCVRQNKLQLDRMPVLKKWGFFYHEYNKKSYLWEFVKIFEKELVIIALTYYENQIVIKGLIVFLIIFIYGAFSFAFIPYKQKKLNFVDQMSTAVCACSLCLGVLIYASQTENLDYLQYTMFLIIGALNAVLILLILSHLFQGYVDKFDDKLDIVRDKIKIAYPNIDFQFPSLRRFLINKKLMKERVDILWAALRYETREGIKRRRKDQAAPLFVSKRRKSTSISQEVSEKDFHKQFSPSVDQQENNAAQSPESNSDTKTVLIKKPAFNGAIQSLIVKQTSDEKHSSESSDSKIYPEIHSGFPSSRQVNNSQENKKLLKHKL